MDKGRTVDVQTFLNAHRLSGYQWVTFALCFGIVLLDGFDTAAIGYIAPSLVTQWHVERPALAPVLSAALFGLACLASSSADSLAQLVAWRFVTGLGLGAAMPNAVTLVSEYCPDERRATITNGMFCGFPLGASCGGFLAAWMIPQFGWRSVLLLGGTVPLVLALLLLPLLPESVRYMVARAYPAERIRAVLARISASAAGATAFVTGERAGAPAGGGSIGTVLSRPYLGGSVMLWLAYFMGLVIFYALINWMPILFRDAGLAPATAALVTALFPLGGFGAIFSGWLMDRFNATAVIAVCFALTAVAIALIGQANGTVALLMGVVLVAGTLMNTAQSSLPALAAAFYPTQGRATGVAWMLGLGRFGGIAGSFLVAELARRNLSFAAVFAVLAVPGLIAAAALAVKQRVRPEDGVAAAPATGDGLRH